MHYKEIYNSNTDQWKPYLDKTKEEVAGILKYEEMNNDRDELWIIFVIKMIIHIQNCNIFVPASLFFKIKVLEWVVNWLVTFMLTYE